MSEPKNKTDQQGTIFDLLSDKSTTTDEKYFKEMYVPIDKGTWNTLPTLVAIDEEIPEEIYEELLLRQQLKESMNHFLSLGKSREKVLQNADTLMRMLETCKKNNIPQ